MISDDFQNLYFWRPFCIFVGHFVSMRIFVLFLKWCSIYNFNSVGPKFRSFSAPMTLEAKIQHPLGPRRDLGIFKKCRPF